jgi:flagellar basal body rod protein FlgG
VINGKLGDALDRIATRTQDVQEAYRSGFEAQGFDVGSVTVQPQASMDPLHVVAPGGCYFIVGDAAGSSRYTRDGGFSLRDGILCGADGTPVSGFSSRTGLLGPLRIDAVDRALERVGNLHIESDGSVCYTRSVVDPRTGLQRAESVVIGRIALARFPAGTHTVHLDSTHVQAPQGVSPHVGIPADANFPMLIVHARDVGGMDILAGLERLQEAYLSFEALRAANSANDGMTKTTMNLLK